MNESLYHIVKHNGMAPNKRTQNTGYSTGSNLDQETIGVSRKRVNWKGDIL
jgi:hypothetical protein